MADLPTLPAAELLFRMKSREISPVELMVQTLEKAHEVNSELSAFITIADDLALQDAASAESKYLKGDVDVPCLGLPISIKDVESTAGIKTTYGSAVFRNHIPSHDGSAAQQFRKAGAILFAKSNTSAFAHKDETDNLLVPPARNPTNPKLSPGGSSGGAAIAVAAGVSSIAHATDGSGSARIPASLCGVVGFKPTYGRIPMWPIADAWAARSQHGVIGRTVTDVAIAMSALATYEESDPLSLSSPVDWTDLDTSSELLRFKRGLYVSSLGPDITDPEVEQVCRRAFSALAREGWAVEEAEFELETTYDWYSALWRPQLSRSLQSHIEKNPELLDSSLIAVAELGRKITIDEHLRAREKRTQFYRMFIERMRGFHFLLAPTLPCAAWPIGGHPVVGGSGKPAHPMPGGRWENLYFFNILGWPAISVPCGTTADGRPVGIQIATRREKDLDCLKLARAIEQLC